MKEIPHELRDKFSMNGKVPITEWYFNEENITLDHLYRSNNIDSLRAKASRFETNYYGDTDKLLYHSLIDFPIHGKDVCIIGSVMPWYESIALEFKCKSCTVIEYRKQICNYDRLKYIQPHEVNSQKFDVILSVSSIEHDGLGRYGDPIDPDGDIKAMNKCYDLLKDSGILFLAVPIGQDEVVWNAHRIYGKIRLPEIISRFKLIGKYGITEGSWDFKYPTKFEGHPVQPVLVLSK